MYGRICVVGKLETISILTNELEQFLHILNDIASQLQAGDVSVSEEGYDGFKADFLATVITAVEIVNGAAYLFDNEE